VAGALCRHGKVKTTCPECRPNPERDFLEAIGPILPHALTKQVAQAAIKPFQLPHVEHLGEKDRTPLPSTTQDYWKVHSARYPGGSTRSNEWAWLRREILKRDQSRCQICGSTTNLQVDHITPISKGGSNSPRNLWTLCADCHTRKTGRPTMSRASQRTAEQKKVSNLLKNRKKV
jgi:5-methylcytosine-specific restriction endonuclease McrA